MWVQFTSPCSLNQRIYCFFQLSLFTTTSEFTQNSVKSLSVHGHLLFLMIFKIQWNHLAYMDTFCSNAFTQVLLFGPIFRGYENSTFIHAKHMWSSGWCPSHVELQRQWKEVFVIFVPPATVFLSSPFICSNVGWISHFLISINFGFLKLGLILDFIFNYSFCQGYQFYYYYF
jgi:hypothetical protein